MTLVEFVTVLGVGAAGAAAGGAPLLRRAVAAGMPGPAVAFAFGVGFIVASALRTVVASEIYLGLALRDCPDTGMYDGRCREAWDEGANASHAFASGVMLGTAGGVAGAGSPGGASRARSSPAWGCSCSPPRPLSPRSSPSRR